MYVDQFKLKTRPFNSGGDTETFLSSPETDVALSRIQHVLLARNGAALLTGGPGVGKSTLISQAMKAIKNRVFISEIDLRQTDPSLLYQMVLLSLGAEPGDGNIADALHRLQLAIRKINDGGRQVTVVIDVNGFTVERANHILRLSHIANQRGGQLNIILLGPHSLHQLLDTPGLIYLRQRIGFRYRVKPLTVAETEKYIRYQIENSRGNPDELLGPGAGMTIFQYVGGVPRLINTLMDAALSQTSSRNMNSLTVETIREVAKDLGWRPLSKEQAAKEEAKSGARKPTVQASVEPKPARRKQDTAKPAEAQDAAKSKPEEKPVKSEVKAEKEPAKSDAKAEKAPAAKETPKSDAKAEKAPAAKETPKSDAKSEKDTTPEPVEPFEQTLQIIDEPEEAVHAGGSVADVASGASKDDNLDAGELTQRLLMAAENLEANLKGMEEAKAKDATVVESEPPPGVPEMDANDTSATGMLRLEDLDSHFAETVFGEDAGMMKAIEDMEKMRADMGSTEPDDSDKTDKAEKAESAES